MPSQPRNYPINHWWVAAFSDEVSADAPLPRRLVDRAVVLYRTEGGAPAALEDRCPHRWLPLSMGKVQGSDLVCGYHGFRFSPDGRCQQIPTQDRIPGKAAVRSFPVLEKPPFIWIWTGERAPGNDRPPDVDWLTEPGWAVIKQRMDLRANYMMLRENVLDLTHFPYAHASSFEITDWDRPPTVRTDGTTVSFEQVFDRSPLVPFYSEPMAVETGLPADRVEWGRFLSPAIHVSGVDIAHPDPAPGVQENYRLRFTHVTTPVSPTETHYFWTVARDHGRAPHQAAAMERAVRSAFNEDKVILEAIQANLSAGGTEHWQEVSVKADEAALHARRIVELLLREEAAETQGA